MNHIFIIGSFVAACTVRVSRFPAPGESLAAESFLLEPGGKGFNMMAGVQRLGIPVKGLLAVGDDLVGALAPDLIARAGLPRDLIHPLSGVSGGGVGFTDSAGESSLAVCAGANALLAPAHIDRLHDQISTAALVAAQFEVPDEPIARAFEIARRAGIPTLLNPSPYRPIAPEILATTSILIMNETEAIAFAAGQGIDIRSSDIDGLSPIAELLRAYDIDYTILTLGRRGAVAFPKQEAAFFQPAFPARTVDMIGAGDAFNAGLMAAWAEGHDIRRAVRFAAACGAVATERPGVLGALPGREQVEILAGTDQNIG
ncbi:MAG: ribokinase [Sphingobium sp.]